MEKLELVADKIFIQYDDCIKCLSYSIIKYLLSHEREYSEFIDYSKIKNKNDKSLIRIALMRKTSNILKELSKPNVEWDCKKSLQQIEQKYDDLCINGYNLDFFRVINKFLFEPSFKSIFIYYPNPDRRFIIDLYSNFSCTKNMDKINLVFNTNLEYTIKNNKDISCFIVSDLDLAKYLIESGTVDDKELLISETRYNIISDKEGQILPLINIDKFNETNNKKIRYGLVKPLTMDQSFFQDLIKNNSSNK